MDADFIIDHGDILYVTVDIRVYGVPALLRVAHRFTDRCYLHLQFESEHRVGVRFRAMKPGTDLTGIVGAFTNELLDQTLREIVARESEPVRNLILAHALSGSALIHPELDEIDPALDPLTIGQPDDARTAHA